LSDRHHATHAGKVARDVPEGGMTLGIVKRTEEEFQEWLMTEPGFVAALISYDDEPVVLEAYQREFLANRSRFRWVNKSRQVGFSFLFALEALARCHLRSKHTAVFVSYNMDDAKEKVLTARQLHEELPLAYQKRLVVDSKTELAFESNGATKRLSRILSHPSKAPRGKKGDVYLDELAHYVNDREVYRGSTALILRSNGQLTGCSTPLGRRGIFWEIANEELRKYPHHTRQHVPWWLCRFFTTDVRAASDLALDLPTEERVERFGRPTLIEQFDSLPIEDFQQEFEGKFVDETYSFFPYELILPCTNDELVLYDEPTSELDPVMSATISEIIATLKDEYHVTSFVVPHDRSLALSIADRVGILMGGRLLTVAPPAALREPTDPQIADFLNPLIDVKNPRFKQLEA